MARKPLSTGAMATVTAFFTVGSLLVGSVVMAVSFVPLDPVTPRGPFEPLPFACSSSFACALAADLLVHPQVLLTPPFLALIDDKTGNESPGRRR